MSSSSLDIWDMNSSSESIPALVVVTGVGGAATVAVEATALLLGCSSTVEDRIVASLALLFLVEGGMVATPLGRCEDGKSNRQRRKVLAQMEMPTIKSKVVAFKPL